MNEATHPPERTENPEVDHEHSDINVRAIIIFAVGLAVSALVIHVVLWWMFQYLDHREKASQPPVPPIAGESRPAMDQPVLEGFDPGHRVVRREPRPNTGLKPAQEEEIEQAMRELENQLPARKELPHPEARRVSDASSGRMPLGGPP